MTTIRSTIPETAEHESYGAVFETRKDAEAAIRVLLDQGVERDGISLITKSENVPADSEMGHHSDATFKTAATGAALGAVAGSVVGALLAGPLGLIGLGPLAAALFGAGGGSVYGALGSVLAGAAMPDDELQALAREIEVGKVLVTVETQQDGIGASISDTLTQYRGRLIKMG